MWQVRELCRVEVAVIRSTLLIACLACVAMAGVYDATGAPERKRHRASDFVYPYFEISAGAQYLTSDYKTESVSHWYHDTDRDEMVYDRDLYYDIYTFEGYGPLLQTRAGVLLFQRGVVFLELGLAWSIGDSRYKYYSRDKEKFKEHGTDVRPFWGFGAKAYPFVDEASLFYGLFLGASVSFLYADNSWEKYGMSYEDIEVGYKFEAGKLWKVSEHYFVGFSLNAAIYWNSWAGSDDEYGYDVFEVGRAPDREPADAINTVQFGATITAVRK